MQSEMVTKRFSDPKRNWWPGGSYKLRESTLKESTVCLIICHSASCNVGVGEVEAQAMATGR